ncbi:hypothetical protein [Streptomyces sp. AC495_CC817]|uniref:hypothetical protein n=1 Tax=Streptomyces sp. AC495_CC817 TaxID=2823900 RepID=UPI001C25ED41|nr:hypothetical protein [Streptomyces sp. AC495_CC817]
MAVDEGAEPRPWSAGLWQRTSAASLNEWRSSSRSLLQPHLKSLCSAINTVASSTDTPEAVAARLAHVLDRCDDLEFRDPAEVTAYMILHLADRYGRVTQILERLFTAGHLPLRRRRLSVLEIGAGPAPALYAVHDFYDDLALWAQTTRQQVEFAPATEMSALDRGPAWSRLLHHFSEEIHQVRREVPTFSGTLPFGVTHPDFTEFSVFREHVRALESKAQLIADEFDRDDETISPGFARMLAQEEGVRTPSAYDLVVMCNFLTNQGTVALFRKEIRGLAHSLTPGGLLIVLGSATERYSPIWADLKQLLQNTGLTPLALFEEPIAANSDPARAALIRHQVRSSLNAVHREGGSLPAKLGDPDKAYRKFPKFRALIWKNQNPPRRGRRSHSAR